MTEAVEIVPLTDRDSWDRLSATSDVPSHGWCYNKPFSDVGITPLLAHIRRDEGEIILPFYERRFRGTVDICSVQSVGGAWLRGCAAGPLGSWNAYAHTRHWVAGYLQFEPQADLAGIEGVRAGNSLFLVRLDSNDLFSRMSPIIRRKQRKAQRLGAHLVTDKVLLERPLLAHYRQTIHRSKARAIYGVPDETLKSWLMAPGTLAVGAAVDGEIASVALFTVARRRAEYHIGASATDSRQLSAWLLGHAMQRLRDMGVEVLNLGGGVSNGDGLHDFKAKFGGEERPLQILRQVYDREVYDRLCREAGAAAGEGWFPAYRAAEARKLVDGDAAHAPGASGPDAH